MNGNSLSGSLPPELGKLENLTDLIVTNNGFNGALPNGIFQIQSLRQLDLGNNRFEGSIPAEIGNLHQLELLNLSRNNFNGSLPHEIGNLVNISTLKLSSNKFTSIPGEIVNLKKLAILYLDNNLFTGDIPIEIFSLTYLVDLHLNGNKFSGTIPGLISNLPLLWRIKLNDNLLSGSVPDEINEIRCRNIKLSNNLLTGLPQLILTSIDTVDVSYNKLGFNDIEINIKTAHIKEFIYAPQDSIGTRTDTLCKSGASFTYTVSADGFNNTYEFYKNGILVEQNKDGVLRFIDLKPTDSGQYNCIVTNPSVPLLKIYARPLNLSVSNESFVRISVYPIPAKDNIVIDFKDEYPGLSRIEILNMDGKLIYQNFTYERNLNIDLTHMQKGDYILRIQTSAFYRSIKIIKI